MSRPRITLVVATDLDGVIGKAGSLPWHLPADLAFFKRTTMGAPIVMGRRTYEDIGRPLPGRRNLVLSRRPQDPVPGIEFIATLDEALALCEGVPELMIIGGGTVYRAALPLADRVVRTLVHTRVVGGDTTFPALDPEIWRLESQEARPKDPKNPFDLSFEDHRRRQPLGPTAADG